MRRILTQSPHLAARYETVQIPPVQSITGSQIAILEHLLPRIDLVVGQPVSTNFRDIKLGLDQVSKGAHRAWLIRWPSLCWEAAFPFMLYVHLQPRRGIEAPIVGYHNLHFLSCASRRLKPAETIAFLDEYELPAEGAKAVIRNAKLTPAERELSRDLRLSD